jgi:hypothetical protein
MERKERVRKHVIGDLPALSDAGCFIERPVDAEINSALAIFLLRL